MAGDLLRSPFPPRTHERFESMSEVGSLPLFMEAKMDWKKKEYSFFSHKKCEYFPCHKTDDPDNFNCLFCYCPLYALGKKCGGNYRYTESGIKDCSNCLIPHKRENYEYITGKYQEIIKMMKLQKEEK